MFSRYFFILLLSHIIGDFYFQTEKIAKKKEKKFKWLCLHCLLYCLAFLFVSIPVISLPLFVTGMIMCILHFLIDGLKYLVINHKKIVKVMSPKVQLNIYVIDQITHIFCIVLGSYYLANANYVIKVCDIGRSIFNVIGVSQVKVISWVVVLLLIHKPANITIAHLLSGYKPKKEMAEMQYQDYKAGRFIGSLERIIMLILITIGQYSAIGLVLTAKSIARYDEIAKNKISAEYYLIGTLLSTGFAIVVSFLI